VKLNNLNHLTIPQGQRPPNKSKLDEQIERVAQGMETQFINYMIEKMRKNIPKNKTPSSTENYYQSLLNYERAKLIAKQNKGTGLQKLIIEQLNPKPTPTNLAVKQYKKNKGLIHE